MMRDPRGYPALETPNRLPSSTGHPRRVPDYCEPREGLRLIPSGLYLDKPAANRPVFGDAAFIVRHSCYIQRTGTPHGRFFADVHASGNYASLLNLLLSAADYVRHRDDPNFALRDLEELANFNLRVGYWKASDRYDREGELLPGKPGTHYNRSLGLMTDAVFLFETNDAHAFVKFPDHDDIEHQEIAAFYEAAPATLRKVMERSLFY